MKKSMYQAIRLFLFSLLLPLLSLILKWLDPEIVYDSPFLFIVIAHVFGLTRLVLYSIVVNQQTLENLGVCKTIVIALIAPAIDLFISQASPQQLDINWIDWFMNWYITYFLTIECIPTIIPIIVKEFLRRRKQKRKA
ncbi:hypothetical protein [Fannyhessea vaginae]|uniref:hypothetical protein n=1 Tax=Fannyhessea vaginae TaxID=82135 RepID=UPI003A80A3CC